MEVLPPAPPEADVIRVAREAMGMTAAAAARRMAEVAPPDAVITAGYWRDIERGTGGRRGRRVTVRAADKTLAWMAVVVNVTPARLEAAGRSKAAGVLAEIRRQRHDDPGLTPLGKQLAQHRMDIYPRQRTWEAFAAATGLDSSLVEDLETGRRTEFSDPQICDLAHAYQMAESDLRKSLANGELITSDGGQSVSEGEAFVRSQHLTDAEWSAVAEVVRAFRGMRPAAPAPASPAGTRRTA